MITEVGDITVSLIPGTSGVDVNRHSGNQTSKNWTISQVEISQDIDSRIRTILEPFKNWQTQRKINS